MKKLLALLLPCLLSASQVGFESVTVDNPDGTRQSRCRIYTDSGYLDPKPVARERSSPSTRADTGVLWVDRNHGNAHVRSTAISGDGYHIFVDWAVNTNRASYYHTMSNGVPVWEYPGGFAYAYDGHQIGISYDGSTLGASSEPACLKWSDTRYPDWAFLYPDPATGFTRVSRDGNVVVTCQNGTLSGLSALDGTVLWSAGVPEPADLQGINLSDDGSVVAVTVYDSCLVYEDGVRRDGMRVGSGRNGTQHAAAISGDGRMLVTGSLDSQLKLYAWDGTHYGLKWQTAIGNPWVQGVGISRDGSTIACGTGYDNGKLCVFDSASSAPLWIYQGYGTTGATVLSVALSEDGSRIAAASWGEYSTSGSYKVFTVHNRSSSTPLFGITRDEEPGSLFACDISADGQLVVCGGKAVHALEWGMGGEVYAAIVGSAASKNVGMASIQQPTRYLQVGTTVHPQATVRNYGDSTATFVTHLVITGSTDSILYHDSAAVSGLTSGSTAPVSFSSWTPAQFDLYSFTFYTALAGDRYHGDDTMVMKSKCFHDGMPTHICPPNREHTVNSSFEPAVTVANNGSYSDDVGCRLVITDSAGATVYSESQSTGTMLPDDSVTLYFPYAAVEGVGAYTATAVVSLAQDFQPANDTLRYGFHVTYEIMYDDGTPEAFYWPIGDDNSKFYVRFTPTIPAPYSITGGRIMVLQADRAFDYVMVCEDESGLPDTTAELGRVENVSTPNARGWIAFDYDILRHDNSDVWMVMHWPDGAGVPAVGGDDAVPIDLRSYKSSSQDTFQQATSADWMARLMQSPSSGISSATNCGLRFRLSEPTPNPFRTVVRFGYEVPTVSRITLKVYDRTGRLVAVPVSGRTEPGRYDLSWHAAGSDGREVTPGVYFCRLLNADTGISSVRKATLVR